MQLKKVGFGPWYMLSIVLVSALAAHAQTTPPQPDRLPPSAGEVLFQSHGTPPSGAEYTSTRTLATLDSTPTLTDADRSAILVTAYDLDARLTPATAGLSMRARLTLRNISNEPLPRIALQISSSLQWESITLSGQPLPLTQHLLDTDTDHTGKVSEAVLTLPQPMAPGASITVDTLYSGTIVPDATRLERIGATAIQALDTDWDAIGNSDAPSSRSSSDADAPPTADKPGVGTALRGFGNVVWYPVSAPVLFLGDGARLFQAVAAMRLIGSFTPIHLRLAVEYHADPPTAAYFCGRRQLLTAFPDDPDAPTATGSGIATADFAAEPIGFRLPSLFLADRPETLIAPLPQPVSTSASSTIATLDATSTGIPMLAVETADESHLSAVATSAQAIVPLLQKWFGAQPLTALTILDHPGETFEDGPILVAPVASLTSASSTTALVHSLTHAWVQTGQPWFDEGLAQFMGLLWTEQQQGLEAATTQLTNLVHSVALAEPNITAQGAAPIGQPLIAAGEDIFYRRKAAAVWWMLRGIVGDQPLAAALTELRSQPSSQSTGIAQATAFEHLLEQITKQDLAWFFNDWVFRDRGLPDLTITDVTPRQLPAGQGHDVGWLVAVSVRNDGAAVAEVPIVIRSGTFSTTRRLRIPGFSSATDRVLVEAAPTEVLVNDGSTPELRTSTHTYFLNQIPTSTKP